MVLNSRLTQQLCGREEEELKGIMTKLRRCCAKLELIPCLLLLFIALSVLVVSAEELIWEDEDTEIIHGMHGTFKVGVT